MRHSFTVFCLRVQIILGLILVFSTETIHVTSKERKAFYDFHVPEWMAHLYTHLGHRELFFLLADWRCFAILLTPATLLA